jgi:uncharacterized protein with PQ loop repeat
MTEVIGWVSSLILVFTIGKQVYKQWSEGKSEGVSKWLYSSVKSRLASVCRLQLSGLDPVFYFY